SRIFAANFAVCSESAGINVPRLRSSGGLPIPHTSRAKRPPRLLAAPPAIASAVIERLLPASPRNRRRRSGVSGRHVSVDRSYRGSEPDCYSYLRVADLLRKNAAAWRDIRPGHPARVQPKNDFLGSDSRRIRRASRKTISPSAD